MVLVVTAIVVQVTVAGLLVSNFLSKGMAGEQASLRALAGARSGVTDAVARINRYINCPETNYCPSTYTLTISEGSSVCINIKEAIIGEKLTVYAKGLHQRREKYMRATVHINPSESSISVSEVRETEKPDDFTPCG